MNDYTWSLSNDTYLAHFGIKGMRWGVRRYQNPDGSLTALGKKRIQSAQQRETEKYAKTLTANSRTAYMKASREYDYSQRKTSDAKILAKLDKETRKSKYRQKMEAEYKKQGMSAKEAAIAAYKAERTRKILIGAAAATVTVAAAYGAYKYYDGYVDKYIKDGTTLQRVENIIAPFDRYGKSYTQQQAYFAVGKGDKSRYAGFYGRQVAANNGGVAFKRSVNLKEGLKVASDNSAYKALKEVASKDANYMEMLKSQLKDYSDGGGTAKQKKVLQKAYADISKGKITKDVYKAVNYALVDHSPRGQAIANGLYQNLASKGYHAVSDVNDRLLSDYKSDNPIIAFNYIQNLAPKVTNERLTDADIQRYSEEGLKAINTKNRLLATPIAVGVASAAVAGVAASNSKNNNDTRRQDLKIVNDYKKKHPDSKLSNEEILNNYYNY